MLQQPLSRFWWLRNWRYFLYIVREITGPVIAAYGIYILVKLTANFLRAPEGTAPRLGYFSDGSRFGYYFGIFALIFAIIHSLTWFFVSGKLAAPERPFLARFVGVFIIFVWLGLSVLLLLNLIPVLQFYGT